MIRFSRMSRHRRSIKPEPVDGIQFDSTVEVARYTMNLKPRLLAGEIRDLKVHVVRELQAGFRTADGEWIRPITYESDFEYLEMASGLWIIEDVKGRIRYMTSKFQRKSKALTTEDFDLKRKMLLYRLKPNERFRLIY